MFWIKTAAVTLLIFLAFPWPSPCSLAAPSQSSISRPDLEEAVASGNPDSNLSLYLELRGQRNDLDRPVERDRQDIQEAEISVQKQLDDQLRLQLTGAAERFNGKNQFYIKEAFVTYSPLPRWGLIRAGQKLMSIGLLNELEHSFSSNPDFYQKLWTAKKGIDLGLETEFYPLPEKAIYFKGAVYSGQLVRPGDQRMDPAEERPREVSLRSRSAYHDAFLARFDQHLAFLDPLSAWGAGVRARSLDLLPFSFEVRFFGEAWDINEIQTLGPDQKTQGFFLFPSFQWKKLSLGYRYGETHSLVGSGGFQTTLPVVINRLLRAELRVTPSLTLMAERVSETGAQILRDELVVRAIVDWNLQ